jgi:hypothetical protein
MSETPGGDDDAEQEEPERVPTWSPEHDEIYHSQDPPPEHRTEDSS